MNTILSKTFQFEAAHYLPNVPKGHKCRRIHGHSYRCTIAVKGNIDPQMGWVMDYGTIKERFKPILEQLDHHFLNEDIKGLENPTSENICQWIWNQLYPKLPELYSITLHETCTSKCTIVKNS